MAETDGRPSFRFATARDSADSGFHAACDRLPCPRDGPPLLPVHRLRAVQTVTFQSLRGERRLRRERYRAGETAQKQQTRPFAHG